MILQGDGGQGQYKNGPTGGALTARIFWTAPTISGSEQSPCGCGDSAGSVAEALIVGAPSRRIGERSANRLCARVRRRTDAAHRMVGSTLAPRGLAGLAEPAVRRPARGSPAACSRELASLTEPDDAEPLASARRHPRRSSSTSGRRRRRDRRRCTTRARAPSRSSTKRPPARTREKSGNRFEYARAHVISSQHQGLPSSKHVPVSADTRYRRGATFEAPR